MANVKVCICPYCGDAQPQAERCRSCGGLFEPLSRQATLNAMGPWQVRDTARPFQPGCSYETLVDLIERGRVTRYSIVRGPTTRQLWQVAKRVAGIAHLLGYCHNCGSHVQGRDLNCRRCDAAFGAYLERNHLGLPDINPLPWDADEDEAGSTAIFRQYFNPPPRPQATGLSSFARDEDLVEAHGRFSGEPSHGGGFAEAMGGPLAAEDFGAGGTTSSGAGAAATAAAPRTRSGSSLAEALPEFDSYTARARQRALERRLKQQQNLVRIFAGMFFGLLLIMLAMQFGLLGGGGSEDSGAAATTRDQPAAPAAGDVDDEGAADATDAGAGGSTTEADNGDAAPGGESAASDPGIAGGGGGDGSAKQRPGGDDLDRQRDPWYAEYQRSQGLIATGRDESKPLPERIAAYEEAVAVLKNIRDRVAKENWPGEDLELEIDRSTRELEKLKLEVFFDD